MYWWVKATFALEEKSQVEKKKNFEGKFSLCKLWLYGQSIKNTHYLAVADHNTWKTATVRHSTYISITT